MGDIREDAPPVIPTTFPLAEQIVNNNNNKPILMADNRTKIIMDYAVSAFNDLNDGIARPNIDTNNF